MSLKLFYSPGACSLVSHIALEEAGAPYEAARIDFSKGEQKGEAYHQVNPHGKVPALVTDQGTITENIAILNYLADRFGGEGAVPTGDPFARARCNELLGWFASSVHIGFAHIFRPQRFTSGEVEPVTSHARNMLKPFFEEIDSKAGQGWLVGDCFSAADSYLLTFYRWARRIDYDLDPYPVWQRHVSSVLERESVQRVIAAEGLETGEFVS